MNTKNNVMKKVSAVIVTYYTGPWLVRALSSVLAQENVVQLIVVNNVNPPDVLAWLFHLEQTDQRVHLITGHGNIGFAAACNLGAKKANGNVLLLLNPDSVLPAGGIRKLLEEVAGKSHSWMTGCRLLKPDGSEQRGGRRELLTPWLAFVEGLRLHRLAPKHPYFRPFNNHHQPVPADTTPVPVISGAFMMLPTQVYWAIGGMDEDYFLHVEDIDFCLRFRKAGGEIYYCPHVLVTHRVSSSTASRIFVEWHKTRGFFTYFRKNFAGLDPPGFISLVNLLIFIRFLGLSFKSLLGDFLNKLLGRQSFCESTIKKIFYRSMISFLTDKFRAKRSWGIAEIHACFGRIEDQMLIHPPEHLGAVH